MIIFVEIVLGVFLVGLVMIFWVEENGIVMLYDFEVKCFWFFEVMFEDILVVDSNVIEVFFFFIEKDFI